MAGRSSGQENIRPCWCFFNDSLYKLDFRGVNFNKMVTLIIDKSNLNTNTKKKLLSQLVA